MPPGGFQPMLKFLLNFRRNGCRESFTGLRDDIGDRILECQLDQPVLQRGFDGFLQTALRD